MVFEQYYTKNRFVERGSTGALGLTIAKSIVERCGGIISVSSIPGEGTAFVATLPLANLRDEPEHVVVERT